MRFLLDAATVTQAAEGAAENGGFEFSFSSIVSILLVVTFLAKGVMGLMGKQNGNESGKLAGKYTEASITKYLRLTGVVYIVVALLFAGVEAIRYGLIQNPIGLSYWAMYLIVLGIFIVFYLLISMTVLKKVGAADQAAAPTASSKKEDSDSKEYVDED